MKDQWTRLAASQGYKVVLVEPYAASASDLTVTVMKIRNAQPDVILLASFTEDAVLLAVTMSALKVRAKAVMPAAPSRRMPGLPANTSSMSPDGNPT
jgi:ABC-type branched-subunit amino acid transport system substrate-binding protein